MSQCNVLIGRFGRAAGGWVFHQHPALAEALMRRFKDGEWQYRVMTDEERLLWLLSTWANDPKIAAIGRTKAL